VFLRLARAIDSFNQYLGRLLSWFILFIVVLVCINVVARYVFQASEIWLSELAQFMHAMVFLGVAGYTLLDNDHVRVDLLYEKFSRRRKSAVDLVGTLFFLIPVCITLIYFSWGIVLSSWKIFEKSAEYGGMPGVFILKSFMWVFSIVLILQGVSVIISSFRTILLRNKVIKRKAMFRSPRLQG